MKYASFRMLKRVDEINSSDRKDLGLGLIDGLFSFEHLLAEVKSADTLGVVRCNFTDMEFGRSLVDS